MNLNDVTPPTVAYWNKYFEWPEFITKLPCVGDSLLLQATRCYFRTDASIKQAAVAFSVSHEQLFDNALCQRENLPRSAEAEYTKLWNLLRTYNPTDEELADLGFETIETYDYTPAGKEDTIQ